MTTMAEDPELLKEFLTETNELLENLDNDLISLETDPANADLLNRIFRAMHTIKGTSSFLGFEQLVELGHATEDVLSMLRNGERIVTPKVMDILLDATNKVKVLVTQIQDKKIEKINLSAVLADLDLVKKGDLGKTEDEDAEAPGDEVEAPSEAPEITTQEPESQAQTPAPSKPKPAKTPDVASKKQGAAPKKEMSVSVETSTIRVDVDRLDDLMNLVGELVLERNRLLQINREFRVNQEVDNFSEKVADTAEKIHFVTSELQLSVLKTRMIPIDRLFKKFPRMVRDISREKKKEVELILMGGETELDKTVIDQLGDPLVHILRNSVDHGIEPPDERKAAGKQPKGTVELSARQEGNHIIVSIRDDGRGINLEKVKNKALEKKLVTQAQLQAMGKQDILQLIFEPGFSTADKVSDLSGRGVGMDVVRTNIRNLGGIIDIQSHEGMGTEMSLKLPLTLAVIQALMVKVMGEIYAIPLASVIETLRIDPSEISNINKKEVIRHRDSVIPLLYLSRLYQTGKSATEEAAEDDFQYVVLVGVAEKRIGLVVNRLLGQEEVVIKSLGEYLGNITGIAGSTITGDGRVRLIVDCGSVVELV